MATRRCVDGKISLGLNPDGPVERTFNLIRVDRLDGSPIALVVNYAMHGTVMSGQNLKISGDAPGVVAAYLEEKLTWPDELAGYSVPGTRPGIRLPVRFVALNDTVVWSAPVEMFCEISLDVRTRSPFSRTFYFATRTDGSVTCLRRRRLKRVGTNLGPLPLPRRRRRT